MGKHVKQDIALSGIMKKHHNKIWKYADIQEVQQAIERGYL